MLHDWQGPTFQSASSILKLTKSIEYFEKEWKNEHRETSSFTPSLLAHMLHTDAAAAAYTSNV